MKTGRRKTIGKFTNREELEEAVAFFASRKTLVDVADTCGVSESTVVKILRERRLGGESGGQYAHG